MAQWGKTPEELKQTMTLRQFQIMGAAMYKRIEKTGF